MSTTKEKIDTIRFGARNFETIRHEEHMSFDEVNSMYPSERIKEKNGVYINKCYIPYTAYSTRIVYFVDGTNGDSYGQVDTKQKALELFELLVSLPTEERGLYDY